MELSHICVVGAGAAGLVAVKSLLKEGLDVVAFEQTDVVGGTWVLRDPSDGTHTSMYPDLLTNLTPDLMAFRDFAFPKDTPLFFSHTKVRKYLEDYCENFDLHKVIRFNTRVTKCTFIQETQQWKVDIEKENKLSEIEYFDGLIVCNGHYFQPRIPAIAGHQEFPYKIMHSHDFRKADDFRNQIVVVVGNGPSANDMLHFLRRVCTKIYHSRRTIEITTPKSTPEDEKTQCHIVVKPEMKELGSDGKVTFIDGTITGGNVDTIIFCTGYRYSYPFLDTPNLTSDGKCVNNLYQQLFSIQNPTLAFVGLPWKIVPFPLFEYQSVWIAKVFSGEVALPPKHSMKGWLRNCMNELNRKFDGNSYLIERFAHCLSMDQFPYCNEIASVSDQPNVPDFRIKGCANILNIRMKVRGY